MGHIWLENAYCELVPHAACTTPHGTGLVITKLGPQFYGADIQKICSRFLLLANTRHVLKLHKDLFRGVDETGQEKSNICKTESHTIGQWPKSFAILIGISTHK